MAEHKSIPKPASDPVTAGDRRARARDIALAEADGIRLLAETLDGRLDDAVALMQSLSGRLVVTGMGKSGHVGAKLAATFASTGTPSFFLHAGEAAHGDLGMIARGDVVLALSHSGDSPELGPVADYCAEAAIPLIAITSRPDSRLGRAADVVIRMPDVTEVCPNNLAPTTSATVALVAGHVLAVLLMESRAFRADEFAAFHPGGRLGLTLTRVGRYLERYPPEVPRVTPEDTVETVINEMTAGRMGCVVVTNGDGSLHGLITEGDLRRAMAPDMFGKTASEIMTAEPMTVGPEQLIRDVVAIMTERRYAHVVVVDDGRVVAILHTKDLMERGYI